MDIVRTPTQDDLERTDEVGDGLRGFQPLETPTGRVLTPQDQFNKKLDIEAKKAREKNLPFAEQVARIEAKEKVDSWTKRWQRRGFVDKENDPFPKMDWSRYSDLKNFEEIGEGKTRDSGLSKEHKVAVFVKWKKYKFKDYSYEFTVMEDSDEALTRALDAVTNRQPVPVESKEEKPKKK